MFSKKWNKCVINEYSVHHFDSGRLVRFLISVEAVHEPGDCILQSFLVRHNEDLIQKVTQSISSGR